MECPECVVQRQLNIGAAQVFCGCPPHKEQPKLFEPLQPDPPCHALPTAKRNPFLSNTHIVPSKDMVNEVSTARAPSNVLEQTMGKWLILETPKNVVC